MLENLLNSKLKKKLLGFFFTFPQRSFSIFELRQLTNSKNPLISKALREFVGAQVISVTSRGQKKYYRINPRFRLYDELLDLLGEDDLDVEDEVVKILKRLPNVKLAILSGIFSFEPHLPVDLLLVGDEINRLRFTDILTQIEKFIGQEVNYSIIPIAEYEYRQMMNDRFIRDILDYPHVIAINTLK